MAFASFTNADSILQQIASQVDDDGSRAINGSTLHQWLTTLQKTSNQLSQELQQQVAGHADTSFLPAYHYNNKIYQQADRQVQEAFTSSQTFLNSASAMTTQTKEASSDTHSLVQQAHHSHTVVTTLKFLVAISKDLDQIDAFMAKGAIVDATRQLLVVLDRQVNEQTNGDELAVGYHLRTRAERYKTFLANTIHDGFMQSIVLTSDDDMVLDLSIQHSIALVHGSANTSLDLKDLLIASTLLQTQYVELSSIQRLIVKKFIIPLLESQGSAQLTVNELHEPVISNLHLVMAPSTAQDNNNDTTALEVYEARCSTAMNQMDHILVIVRFVFEHLFDSEPYWITIRQLFGRLFLPDVFQLIITSTLAPAIPSTTTSANILALLASLASSAAALEQQCIVDYAGMKPPSSTDDDNDDLPLTRYVSQLDQHVAHQRRSRLLHDARQVMLRQIYDAEPETNGGISITQTPRILCAMIQEFTKEAISLEEQQHYPTTSMTLRSTIHDILTLYMSIMPSIHRPELLQHADRAIVFRNDCYWLATHTQQNASDDVRSKLEQLGGFWQNVVVAQLMNTVAIVLDRTEEWQRDGDGQQQQQNNLALDSNQPMNSSQQQQQQQQQQSMSLEDAIAIIVCQVQSLANSIKSVVTPTLYNTILVELVNGVVGRLTEDLLAMADISADASHSMALALNGVAQLANVFLSDNGGVSEIQLREWIPRWQGFWMIKEMLELNMADILAALHRGDLCMFTHQELVHLVCALFADTPRRDETLHVIKTSDLNGSTTDKDIASLLDPIIESPLIKHSPQPQQHLHDHGILTSSTQFDRDLATSSNRLDFDMEENNDDDSWDEQGWSDDDDLDFNITPFKKDPTQSNQELKSVQGERTMDENRNMDTDMNNNFDPGINMPLQEDADFDPGMIMPLDDQYSHRLNGDNEDKVDHTQINQEHLQEKLPLGHPIEGSRNSGSDGNDATTRTMDDQDNHYLDMDSEDHLDNMDDDANITEGIREDTTLLDLNLDESPHLIDLKDGILDDETTRLLDIKDDQNLEVLLEDNYGKGEPNETIDIQHEDSQSPRIEQPTPDVDADNNGALDHGLDIPLEDHHTGHLDLVEEDNRTIDHVEENYAPTAQECDEDEQLLQNEHLIDLPGMDTEMTDDFNSTTNKLQSRPLNRSLGLDSGNNLGSGMNTPSENHNKPLGSPLGGGEDEGETASRIIPLDDKVNHYVGVSLEADDNSGKDDNTQTPQKYHEDTLSPQDEHPIDGLDDMDTDKDNDFDISSDDHDNTLDTNMTGPQYDKNDPTRTHQEHYEDSQVLGSTQPDEQGSVEYTIKNDGDDLRMDVPLDDSFDNLLVNDNGSPLDHEKNALLDDQDNQLLGEDGNDNHDKDNHSQAPRSYLEDYQPPKHTIDGSVNVSKEQDQKDIDLDTEIDISTEIHHFDTWKGESLNSGNHAMDMLLDDEEGGGWSDADHDIDLDLDLLSKGHLTEPLPPSIGHTAKSTVTTTHTPLSLTDATATTSTLSIPSPQNSPTTSLKPSSPMTPLLSPNKINRFSHLQHHQSPIVKVSPSTSSSTSPSKFNVIYDMMVDENYDDDEDGGWSDAENVMEFDTTIISKAITPSGSNDINRSPAETTVHHPGPTPPTNSNDNTTTSSKSATLPARSTLMMDLALDDDDGAGGGWSDADEELF
ncbi:unnamed protein product [Absidia cylindrospora]